MAKKELLKTSIKRVKGKLYFCGTSDGFVTVNVTDMAHSNVSKEKKK